MSRIRLVKLPPPRLLTLDAYGTIYTPRPSVAEQYAALYAQHHPAIITPPTPAQISQTFKSAYKDRVRTHPNYLGGETEWWYAVIRDTFAAFLSAPEELVEDAFIKAVYAHFNSGDAYEMFPDILPFLDDLKDASKEGTTVGIISNSDTRSRTVLRALGVLALDDGKQYAAEGDRRGVNGHSWIKRFRDVVLSCEIGVDKPDPRIFEAALVQILDKNFTPPTHNENVTEDDALVVAARNVRYWHVGDDYDKDIFPITTHASLYGWGAIYINRDSTSPVKLKDSGRVIEVADLRNLVGIWSSGVEVLLDNGSSI
ncbi:HAD-like domain-containing protein [Kockiozyma suomiensis]|uniref:HAD-like domain-containing protein n=1 Tax=Kockiozyma suomiensis TaxID=1337062 RepID=UPI003343E3E2